jgi:hypothetical protein
MWDTLCGEDMLVFMWIAGTFFFSGWGFVAIICSFQALLFSPYEHWLLSVDGICAVHLHQRTNLIGGFF